MSQSKKGSAFEVSFNLLLGIVTGWITNMLVLPMFGYEVTGGHGLALVLIFSAISLVRGYCVRRLFNMILMLTYNK